MTHRAKTLPHPLVTNIIPPPSLLTAPVQPGVVASAAQNQCVELVHPCFSKQRKPQLPRPVFLLEDNTKRMLRTFFWTPVPATLDPNATLNGESRAALRKDKLQTR